MVVKVYDFEDQGPDGKLNFDDVIPHLREQYQNLMDLPDSDHILKFRYWAESDYQCRPRYPDGDVVHTLEGDEMTIRRRGLRSYTDYCEGGDLFDLIGEYSWLNHGTDDW